MLKKIRSEDEQKIIELYQSGLSMAKIGKQYNINSVTVMKILDKNNIVKRTKGGIYTLPEQEIITKYQTGESCQSIANFYKVSFHTISNILEKNNIARDNKYKNINLNENYFEQINTKDKAYFLGFMLTDGNVSLKENTIQLSLSSKDEEILKIFKQVTGSTNKIRERKNAQHDEKTFGLRSHKWKKDLAQYGIVPQKTAICQMPTLPEELMPHLIRGMIDGDGWISAKSRQIGFCGNEKTVTQLHDYLVKTLNIYNVKIIQSENNLWQITWASKKDIEKIGNYIYQNKDIYFLSRKYNNFLQIIQGNIEVNN